MEKKQFSIRHLEEFWCLLEKYTEKYQKYFEALATIPPKINTQAHPKIQYNNRSDIPGDDKNA